MKLVGLRHIKFNNSHAENMDPTILCDMVLMTEVIEQKVHVYNVDHILEVEPTTCYEQTFLDSGRVVKTNGEKTEYMNITFMNGKTITVLGSLKTLER